jgi:hypothetical protein
MPPALRSATRTTTRFGHRRITVTSFTQSTVRRVEAPCVQRQHINAPAHIFREGAFNRAP